MYIGTKCLIIRNLIHRNTKDIDILINNNELNKYIKLRRYLKKYNINLDIFVQKECNIVSEFENYKYKNRFIKLQLLYQVLYYKYKLYKIHKNIKNTKHPPTRKHEYDLINVFHNLGKEKSLEEINKIKQNTPLKEDDIKELIKLMEIGINNTEEI